MADVNANINIDINTTAALANLRKLETEINKFQRTIGASNSAAAASQAALNKALVDGINNTGLFSAKVVNAQDSMSRFTNALESNKLSLGQYTKYATSQLPLMSKVFRKEFDTIQQVAESRVKKINTQYLALGKTVDGITKAVASTPTGLAKGYATDVAIASQRQQIFNKMIDDGSTKLLNWGKNTQWAGRQLMVGFTLPMAALGAAAAKTFMEIDKATVAFERVYGDLETTGAELERNTQAVKDLGSEYTKYGIAVSETIGISARAAATGATNEGLLAATEQTLRFATLGQIDYSQALDTTISLQTAFAISNDNLATTIDYLNAVENQTVLTMDDMSLAIPRVATVIKGLGGDVQDLAIMMTAMREGGVSAENAANALKSGLARMINPTKAATNHLAELGINLNGIVNQNKGDVLQTIRVLGTELDKLGSFERQQALEKVFGKYQYARMSALFTNITKESSQASRAMDLAGMSAENLADIANSELSKVSESTSVKFKASMEQLKLSIAPLGEAFLKMITPAVEMVTKIADAFNNLPDPVKNALAAITVGIAGLGPVLLMGVGLMGNLVANVIKGIQVWRKFAARIRGDSSAFNYMASAELDALAATNALEGKTSSLTGKLQLQAGAVAALTAEYNRFTGAAGIAGAAMGRMGGAGRARGGRAPIKMATGGVVPGSGSGDKIPALLEPGETVINKKASQSYGPILASMNSGNLPGFSKGLIPQGTQSLDAAHMTSAFAKDSKQWKYAMSQLTPALQEFATKFPEMVRVVSKLTATLPRKLNQQLGRGGATIENFSKGWAAGGSGKLFGSAAMGGANLSDAKIKTSLMQMEKAIGERAISLAKGTAEQKVTDAILEKAQLEVVAEYKTMDASAKKAAVSLEKAAASVGQVRIQPTASELRKLSAQGVVSRSGNSLMYTGGSSPVEIARSSKKSPFNLGYAGRGSGTGKAGKHYSASNIPVDGGLAVASKSGAAYGKAMKAAAAKEMADMPQATMKASSHGSPAPIYGVYGTQDGKLFASSFLKEATKGIKKGPAQSIAKNRYMVQQSAQRRESYNISQMQKSGMTDTQILRQLRRLEEAKKKQLIAAQKAAQISEQTVSTQSRVNVASQEDLNNRTVLAGGAAGGGGKGKKPKSGAMGKFGRGMGGVSMALGTASMIPFMAQNEEGKFMGMDANMLGMGMMGASMAGPAMKGIASGGAALAAALGVSAGAVAAVALPVIAVAAGAIALKKGFDSTIESGRQLARSMTTTSEEMESIADLFGTKTYASKRKSTQVSKLTGLTSKDQEAGREFAATEQGKSMVDQAKFGLEKQGKDFAQTLGTQLSQMVISGAITPSNANMMASGITESLGRQDITADVVAQIDKILAPNGDDVTNSPLEISANIKAALVQDEESLKNAIGKGPEEYNVFERAFSGEYDAAAEKAIAYAQATSQTTKSIMQSYDDQISAQDEYISSLDKKIKAEDDEEKKAKLKAKKKIAERNKEQLEQKKASDERERRDIERASYRGRQEAIDAGRLTTQEMGISDAGSMFGKNTYTAKTVGDEQKLAYGGILGNYFNEATGIFMDQKQAEEFEIKWLVDIQSGRIDPVALQSLQIMEEEKAGTADKILQRVVELQYKGDTEEANKIIELSSQMDTEVLTIFNTVAQGEDPEYMIEYGKVLNSFPTDIAVIISGEMKGLDIEELKGVRSEIESLQEANVDVSSLIADDGASLDRIKKTSKALDGVTSGMKKYKKEIENVGKATSKQSKIDQTVSVATKIVNDQGYEVDPKDAAVNLKELADKAGMTEAEVLELPEDTLVQTISMMIVADSIRASGEAMIASASKLRGRGAARLLNEGQKLIDAADALENASISTARTSGAGDDQGEAPPVEEEGGGGGTKKENPLKDLKKTLLEQIKLYADTEATMKIFDQKRKSFTDLLYKITSAGKVKKRTGTLDSLLNLGLTPEFAQQIADMGPKDAKKWINKNSKNGKLTQSGKAQSQASIAGTIANRMSQTRIQNIQLGGQVAAARSLKSSGASQDLTNLISGDAGISQEYNRLLSEKNRTAKKFGKDSKEAKIAAATYRDYTRDLQKTIDKQKELADQQNPLEKFGQDLASMQDVIQSGIDQTTVELTNASDIAFAAQYGKSKDEADLLIQKKQLELKQYEDQIDDLDEINKLHRHEIDLLEHSKKKWNDKIKAVQDQIDAQQESIDKYQRENEIRNQTANILNHSLEILSQKEDEINKVYNDRVEALNQVVAINDHLLQQQQDQLGMAQALSSGDVYAAAQAQQQMNANSIGYASQLMSSALDEARNNQVSGLKTESGMTRAQTEQQLQDIKEQNYQTDLLVTDLQNKIYDLNVSMVPYKNEIASIDKTIADYNEKIWINDQAIYEIQKSKIDPITNEVKLWDDRLKTAASQLDIDIASATMKEKEQLRSLELIEAQYNAAVAQKNATDQLGRSWKNVAQQIAEVNRLLKTKTDAYNAGSWDASVLQGVVSYDSNNEVNREDTLAAIRKDNQSRIDDILGGVPKMATGGVVSGSGGMDSMLTMLTPGEFVVRKSMVDKYGKAAFGKMNQGSLSLPRFNVSEPTGANVKPASISNISAPVYNSYSINVPVNQPNASAEEIAYKVMTKIKNMDNASVRRISGY